VIQTCTGHQFERVVTCQIDKRKAKMSTCEAAIKYMIAKDIALDLES
jgi:hypothetical protein